MAKTNITFYIHVKDGKKTKCIEHKDLQILNEARREAEKAGTFLCVGAHVTNG